MSDHTPTPWHITNHQEALVLAANIIAHADVLLIGAGAGASVDSGLPDFRSKNGFWKTYPPAQKLGFSYVDVAGGPWFEANPPMAWGFILHCDRLFTSHEPHEGYHILKRWADTKKTSWVYTSNVDQYFHRVGFDPARITEIHGFRNIHQCTIPCCRDTWPGDMSDWVLDEASLRLMSPPPRCPNCGALARPNTLMFNDERWVGDATRAKEHQLTDWLNEQHHARVAVIEIGAGKIVPNVRFQCERYARGFNTSLIRINPADPDGPEGTIGLPMPALEGLRAINQLLLQM